MTLMAGDLISLEGWWSDNAADWRLLCHQVALCEPGATHLMAMDTSTTHLSQSDGDIHASGDTYMPQYGVYQLPAHTL